MRNLIICGILLLGIFNCAYSKPAENNNFDIKQSEDYYADDESLDSGIANQQLQPSKPTTNSKGLKAYFAKPNSTVTAVAGKDIVLQCEVINLTDEVVLWYKGKNIVANDGNVLLPMYGVDNDTHTLTIINATNSSQGEYFCELQPGKHRLYTNVVISREPLEVVVPESSPSMQDNSDGPLNSSSIVLLILACLGPFLASI